MTATDQFKKTYFEECAELLDALYCNLSLFAEGASDEDTMHAVFRAVHSIKGGGGAFGFTRLVKYAHSFETLLDILREQRQSPCDEILSLLLRATDLLADLIDAAHHEREPAAGYEDEMAGALEAASARLGAAPAALTLVPAAATPDAVEATYDIAFAPYPELFRRASEPLLLVRELKRLGPLAVTLDMTRLPDLTEMDPEKAYFAWRFTLTSSAPAEKIAEIFEFVTDDCELSITRRAPQPPERGRGQAPTLVAGVGGDEAKVPGSAQQYIRVDVEKVDRVVNLVGELVINQSMLTQLSVGLPPDFCATLLDGFELLSQQLRELQESVMAIRAQPVKSVFSRMQRLVRELAGQLGKDARLLLAGESTEIDKTVIEQLSDPLTHMLRNALDHGIESPEERERAGKPTQGTILLSAGQRSGRIIIEISDDGRGLNRAKILAKAQAQGIIPPGATPSDEEIDNLIFAPGFSTADRISSVSGRGVGMDVVRRNVQSLGGRITVESRFGQGSRFTLSLPLTLAVLDGMVVTVGAETYIVPLGHIRESLRPSPADVHPVVGKADLLSIRGEYVPLLFLHRQLSVADAVQDPCCGTVVIVESEDGSTIGLVVDELVGQQQVVVKSLEANYDPVDGIGGATILGSGRVALILDVTRICENFRSASRRPASLSQSTAPMPALAS